MKYLQSAVDVTGQSYVSDTCDVQWVAVREFPFFVFGLSFLLGVLVVLLLVFPLLAFWNFSWVFAWIPCWV